MVVSIVATIVMAAEAQAQVQALLRFLTHDAKVPLAVALPKYNLLRKHGLSSADAIAKSDTDSLKSIFDDEKITKQVHNAARRVSNPKKRAALQDNAPVSPKYAKTDKGDCEAELALPQAHVPIDELRTVEIETNRAPLFLAFALVVSKYTLPDQPLSSRLSLAQAVTSAGAQSKAKYIGLTDSTAEDEGWAQGQPSVKLMGRKIAVMRRHVVVKNETEDMDSQKTIEPEAETLAASHEALWGIDLEALKRSNGPLIAGKMGNSTGPPVHKAQAARSYLLKAIDLIQETQSSVKTEPESSASKVKNISVAARTARKEKAVAMLLETIDHVCNSWSSTLSEDELDRRASAWYAKVRPEVEVGKAGWGQRGKVPLRAILDLAKDS